VSDEKKKVSSGTTKTITLRRKGKSAPTQIATAQPKRGIVPVDDESARYLRRGKPLVTFYDLGTRLRSVETESDSLFLLDANESAPAPHDGYINEYVELRLESPALLSTNDDGSLALTRSEKIAAGEWSRFLALLLGSRADPSHVTFDPFGTTKANGSGRTLPNVMPIPFPAVWNFELALRFKYADASVKTYAIDDRDGLRPAEWQPPVETPSGEHWNAINLSDETAQHEGKLKPKASELKNLASLKLTSPTLFYEAFDTADVNVKVTSEPSPSAAAVAFPSSFKSLRVYLVPRVAVMFRQTARTRHENWSGTVSGSSTSSTATAISTAYQGFFAERMPIHSWARLHSNTWGTVFRLTGAEDQAMRAFNKVFDRSNIFTTRTLVETRLHTNLHAGDDVSVAFESGAWSASDLDARNATALTAALSASVSGLVESSQTDTDTVSAPAQGQLEADAARGIPSGTLVAALADGARVFYVWNMEDDRIGAGYRVLSLRV
jgi:hypothetical protein